YFGFVVCESPIVEPFKTAQIALVRSVRHEVTQELFELRHVAALLRALSEIDLRIVKQVSAALELLFRDCLLPLRFESCFSGEELLLCILPAWVFCDLARD